MVPRAPPAMPDLGFLPDAPLLRTAGAPPLQRQLHQRLRQAILDGLLAPGGRLPGTRALADALGVSRNTVTAAYEQLAAEGFVQPDRRGTQVAALQRPPAPARAAGRPAMAQRLARLQPAPPRAEAAAALRPGVPALAQFPAAAWRRALDRAARLGGPAALDYGDPAGEPALRAAIARHLGIARGVRCTAAQVLITSGAQEALALCVQLLTNPGERAWTEDPGYRGAQAALQAGQLRVLPRRVDAQGLVATARDWRTQTPRLVYTTPSHQYPGGSVLAVARRLALIEAARRHGAWIVEDDYDSEFRHGGEPLGAMQGLVADAPVLYLGTFSKTMFPALRIGFLVLPPALHDSVHAPLAQLARGAARHTQLALADFIESGQFSRHLGRMRRLYRERQQALRAALQQHLRVPHRIEGGHSGLHLLLRLPPRYPDAPLAAAARAQGMGVQPLSGFALQPRPEDNGLVLGYGNTAAERFDPLVRTLAWLLDAAAPG